jgi:hypothetical protein
MIPRKRGRSVSAYQPLTWRCGCCRRRVDERKSIRSTYGRWTLFCCPSCRTPLAGRWLAD